MNWGDAIIQMVDLIAGTTSFFAKIGHLSGRFAGAHHPDRPIRMLFWLMLSLVFAIGLAGEFHSPRV